MTTQVEQNHFLPAFQLATQGFINRTLDRVVGFRCRYNALVAGEQYAGVETRRGEVPLCRHFLFNQRQGEQRLKIRGAYWLLRYRVEHRG
ncbi:MAG: hypothetical protein R3198_00815 [Marinobacter sp.]|nr:hypothetical protein [Marinobacter sp.]